MSVTIANYKDAIAFAKNAQRAAPQVKKKIFDVFGTSGCLLNSEDTRTLNQNFQSYKTEHVIHSRRERKEVRLARKKYLAEFQKTRQEWFTASEIIASAAQGCGSCNALRQIIQDSFSGNERGLSDIYEYSVSQDFGLRRRPIGVEGPVETIQLFQPPGIYSIEGGEWNWQFTGLAVRFERFHESNFLNSRDISIARLRGWMGECLSSHKNCSQHGTTQDDSSRPARLLSLTPIQRHSESGIRLIETETGSSYQYACLSHRWDDAVKCHKTTTGNILKFLDFLNLERLPASFRDAISIARELSIPYLWIDSLCIIQHGDSGKDLDQEIAKMSSIYRNSRLTIAAVSSPNSSGGCFIKDKWPDICFLVSKNINEAYPIGARVLDMKDLRVSINIFDNHYRLLSRAWVLQERLLSPRLLQCNYGEFAFECLESSLCECNSSLAPHQLLGQASQRSRNLHIFYQRRLLLQDVRKIWNNSAFDDWKEIVEIYMQLELSVPSDVLPAIAGCAQAFALHRKSNYVAGIWKESLPASLLWHVKPPKRWRNPAKSRPKDSMAPTWSWASVSMGQTIGHINCRRSQHWLTSDELLLDAIKEVYYEPESAINPFGKLKNAFLRLDAVLYPWCLRIFCRMAAEETNWKSGSWMFDLYAERSNHSIKCTTEIQGLAVDGTLVDICRDTCLAGDELVTKTFSHCIGDPAHPCRLARIYLLHTLHKENLSGYLDVFLLLKQIPPTNGKPDCYQRIGLMKLSSKDGRGRTWHEMIHGRLAPRQEEFWLF